MATNDRTPGGRFAPKAPPAESTPPPVAPPPAGPDTVSGPEKRRGPGRPRKDEGANSVPGAESAPKRGRPKKGKSTPIDASQLGGQLMGLHLIAAKISGIPELEVTKEEADALGAAVANVCDEYDLSIDGKTGAFIQLLATAAMIYMPRVIMVKQRVARQKSDQARVINGDSAGV